MTRIKVDFNNLVRQGQVRASLRHADGELVQGQTVEAFDPTEDLSYEATVVQIDKESGRVYLDPHWEAATDDAATVSTWTFEWTTGAGQATHAFVSANPVNSNVDLTSRSAANLVPH